MHDLVTVTYTASVLVPAGWRSVSITAKTEKTSEKRVKVVEVTDVDGLGSSGYGSRTGAKRQTFHVGGIAAREVGKIKNISSLNLI